MDDGLRVECWDEQRAKSCCDRFGFSLDHHGNFWSRLITLIVIVSRLRLASNDGEAGHWQPDKMGDYLVNGTTNGRVFYR